MTDWRDSVDRRNEVKAAFAEGWRLRDARDKWEEGPAPQAAGEAWHGSDARARLGSPLLRLTGFVPPFRAVGPALIDGRGERVDGLGEGDALALAKLLNRLAGR